MNSSHQSREHRSRWATALAVTYTFTLGAAFLWTYLPRYFVSIGWTSVGIGFVIASAALVRVFAMPFWARVAESSSSTTNVVRAVSTVGAMILWLLPHVSSTLAVYVVFFAIYATWNAFLPLADSLTVRQLGSEAFGRVRSFGSAGFGVVAIGVAVAGADDAHAIVSGWAPWIVAVLGTIGAAATWLYPQDEVAIRAPDFPEALRLLRRPALLWLFGLSALHWATQAPYNLFLVFLAEAREMPGWVPGACVAVGICAEVVFLARGRELVNRVGPERLFAVGAALTAARWLFCAALQDPFALVVTQVVHGATFGAFLLSAMAILDREVVLDVRDSGQAVFYVIVFGFGGALGSASSGWLNDAYGPSTAFAVAGGTELVVAVVAGLYAASVVRRRVQER